jgi:hypothetical protein
LLQRGFIGFDYEVENELYEEQAGDSENIMKSMETLRG